jgi:Uma2 family endonuclease
MATLVMDPRIEEALLEQRRAAGGDKFDEVWDGVYVMAPMANTEHQAIVSGLNTAISIALAGVSGAQVYPGINVSDRREDWEKNYRCPDVEVILPGSKAVDCGPFHLGGPDFLVEVASDHDRSREKFDFYAQIGVREMLLIDRNPWLLELYRLEGSEMVLIGRKFPASHHPLGSLVLPLTFNLLERPSMRPQIEVVHLETNQQWLV